MYSILFNNGACIWWHVFTTSTKYTFLCCSSVGVQFPCVNALQIVQYGDTIGHWLYWIQCIHCLLPPLLQFTIFVVSNFIAYHFNVCVQNYLCSLSYPSCFAAPLYQYLPHASPFPVCNCNNDRYKGLGPPCARRQFVYTLSAQCRPPSALGGYTHNTIFLPQRHILDCRLVRNDMPANGCRWGREGLRVTVPLCKPCLQSFLPCCVGGCCGCVCLWNHCTPPLQQCNQPLLKSGMLAEPLHALMIGGNGCAHTYACSHPICACSFLQNLLRIHTSHTQDAWTCHIAAPAPCHGPFSPPLCNFHNPNIRFHVAVRVLCVCTPASYRAIARLTTCVAYTSGHSTANVSVMPMPLLLQYPCAHAASKRHSIARIPCFVFICVVHFALCGFGLGSHIALLPTTTRLFFPSCSCNTIPGILAIYLSCLLFIMPFCALLLQLLFLVSLKAHVCLEYRPQCELPYCGCVCLWCGGGGLLSRLGFAACMCLVHWG